MGSGIVPLDLIQDNRLPVRVQICAWENFCFSDLPGPQRMVDERVKRGKAPQS